MAQLFPREIWEEERTLLAPRGASLMFSPTGRLKPQFSCFSVYPHACREGSQFIFPESTCGSLGNIIMGLFLYTHNNPFCRNAFYSHGSFFFFFPVAHPQDPHHPSEKPVIHCHKCGEPCKGEVLRVQTKHFHIKCFTCKGMVPPASWSLGVSVCAHLGVRPFNPMPGHQVISEFGQRPWHHFPSLVWVRLDSRGRLVP